MPGSARARDATTLRIDGDERLARAKLRRQIGRLEPSSALSSPTPFPAADRRRASPPFPARSPRALGLGDLEAVRDSLADRIGVARRRLRIRAELETRNRELLERMLERPAEHKWLRISRADVGEPGCGHWHSRPRLGPLGMLMGWWRVKVSSGCPLSGRLAAVERETRRPTSAPGAVGLVSPRRAERPRRHHRAGSRGRQQETRRRSAPASCSPRLGGLEVSPASTSPATARTRPSSPVPSSSW